MRNFIWPKEDHVSVIPSKGLPSHVQHRNDSWYFDPKAFGLHISDYDVQTSPRQLSFSGAELFSIRHTRRAIAIMYLRRVFILCLKCIQKCVHTKLQQFRYNFYPFSCSLYFRCKWKLCVQINYTWQWKIIWFSLLSVVDNVKMQTKKLSTRDLITCIYVFTSSNSCHRSRE